MISCHGRGVVVEPQGGRRAAVPGQTRARRRAFFPMFDVPFLYGAAWDAESDDALEQVIVLSEPRERAYLRQRGSGRPHARPERREYRVVGVLDEWDPMPKFYDLNGDPFEESEDAVCRSRSRRAATAARLGNTNCWKPCRGDGFQAFLSSECVWVQFWVELRNGGGRGGLHEHSRTRTSRTRRRSGVSRGRSNNRVTTVMQWLEDRGVVPDEASSAARALADMFLVVCLLNTIGLLLAKFLRQGTEIGLRRALGASRRALFQQYSSRPA